MCCGADAVRDVGAVGKAWLSSAPGIGKLGMYSNCRPRCVSGVVTRLLRGKGFSGRGWVPT